MSKFYFGGDSGNLSDEEDNLPYPEALPRSDFIGPTFDAALYLSTLSGRHQTLEDLRSDLRERSQTLSGELLDLVNTNYEKFLGLGSDLQGGEEKIEDVRVGLLGFKRGVEDVKIKVGRRREMIEGLLGDQKKISSQISLGRRLLEVDARLEELEDRLMVSSLTRDAGHEGDSWSDSDDDDEDNDIDEGKGDGREQMLTLGDRVGGSLKRLQRLVHDYRHVERLSAVIGAEHPFIVAQESRTLRVKNTILLDLGTALKQGLSKGKGEEARLVRIMGIYKEFNAIGEAIQILKDIKSK